MNIIYLITNKINDKKYIGQTIQPINRRWTRHVYDANHIKTTAIACAIRKYGKENFEIRQIASVESNDPLFWLNKLEPLYIKAYNSLSPNGYNLDDGGKNKRMHSDSKKKLSEAKKGQIVSSETKQKLREAMLGNTHLLGKFPSKETKLKISESLKGNKHSLGYKHTEESKAKMSASRKGKIPWNKGLKNCFSEETLLKKAESMRGQKRSKETKQKLSEIRMGAKNPFFGKHHSEETKQNIAAKGIGRKMPAESIAKAAKSRTGQKRSEESKARMSAAQIKRWDRVKNGASNGS